MTDTMRERIARAIWQELGTAALLDADDAVRAADAALAAMESPTEKMLKDIRLIQYGVTERRKHDLLEAAYWHGINAAKEGK